MATVYLETSFVSALVTDRTDVASLYRREASRDWWANQATWHRLFVSNEVIRELSRPGFPGSSEALRWVADVPALAITDEALGLAELFVRQMVMPRPAGGDALHVAIATVHEIDYMLSWNVRHLANPNKIKHLQQSCLRVGLVPPAIITPELLWELSDE